jgi:phospholipase C
MIRGKMLAMWGLLISAGAILVAMNGCSGVSSSSVQGAKIQHVVIVFQENRTPDNLFQDQNLIAEGADIAASGINSLGQTIPLAPIDLGTVGPSPQNYDLSHSHQAFISMYDNGKMDGANLITCTPTASCSPYPNPQFMYVMPSDVAPYFAMAEQYTFGDRMFQTNQGPSMPAHQYIIAGTSWDGVTGSTLFQAELPTLPVSQGGSGAAQANTGCPAPLNETVRMIDVSNPSFPSNETQTMFPCWEHPTLMDLLDAQNISWKYYANAPSCAPPAPCPPSGIWVGPNAIQHLCGNSAPGTPCGGPEWDNHIFVQTQILTDISNGQLPAVSWVIPTGQASDHAEINDGEGPSWVSSIVNGIGNSPYWANTAIIVAWDDWGGWYDHVAPAIRSNNSYEYGFRVPLIVISPYAKSHYISHVTHDFGSILKFIETVYNLPTIDPSVGFADSRADDLSDCFNFSQTPSTFTTIPAQYDAAHFLNDKRPPVDPDDD